MVSLEVDVLEEKNVVKNEDVIIEEDVIDVDVEVEVEVVVARAPDVEMKDVIVMIILEYVIGGFNFIQQL